MRKKALLLLGLFALTLGATPARSTHPAGERRTIAGLKVDVWKPAHSGPKTPLVIFSHGFHGNGNQSKFLTSALAADGYLVVAPNHKDAGWGAMKPEVPFQKIEGWTDQTYLDRRQDIVTLLDALSADSQWQFDRNNVGLIGHSLGGYPALGLAGGWASWKIPQARAVIALSPYSQPFNFNGRLGSLGVPVMYQGGTLDFGITPAVKGPRGSFVQTASPAYFVEFARAGHLAWTDLNPRFQPSIDYYCEAFFDRYLKGDTSVDLSLKKSDVISLKSK